MVLGLGLVLAGCGGLRRDLDDLCEVAEKVAKDKSVPVERGAATALSRWEPKTKDGKAAQRALQSAHPSQVSELTAAAAKDAGIDGFRCDALVKLSKSANVSTDGGGLVGSSGSLF